MEIDPQIWPVISGEVSIAWVSKRPDDSAVSITKSVTQTTFEQLSASDPKARRIECYLSEVSSKKKETSQFNVIVHENATFHDLKHAVSRMLPHLRVQGLHFTEGSLKHGDIRHNDSCKFKAGYVTLWYRPECVSTS